MLLDPIVKLLAFIVPAYSRLAVVIALGFYLLLFFLSLFAVFSTWIKG
ncbi:hypothetical protein GWK48_08745 [Metallosphaera tengchongensis]|uniref:Uncharacterized protein n=1 Tax=Metallosphaera tengchongensis TaxID=1532350 RepID=A0A6N0NYJ5_9CREN|nr:hypothetical protein [Metallosphaera tengchongensis]QKR00448.1 hypothetical protein GWK48_08745 [Metallosphaera tengchongensis]